MVKINKINVCIVALIGLLNQGINSAAVNNRSFSASDIHTMQEAIRKYPNTSVFCKFSYDARSGNNDIPLLSLCNIEDAIKEYPESIIDIVNIIDMFVKKGQKISWITDLMDGNITIPLLLVYKPELLSKENLHLFFDGDPEDNTDIAKIYKLLNESKPIEEVLELSLKSCCLNFILFFPEVYREKHISKDRIEFVKNTFWSMLIKNYFLRYIKREALSNSDSSSKINEQIVKSGLKRIVKGILPEYMMRRRDIGHLKKIMEEKRIRRLTELTGRFLSIDTAIDAITKSLTDQERVIWEEAVAEAKKEKEREIP